MDIRDSIEEKYTNYLNCETDDIDLTVEEAKFILVNDKKVHFVDDLLERAWGIVLSELEKKDKRLNRQFKLFQKKDKEIEELKADNSHQWEERCKLTFELEKKDEYIKMLTDERDTLIQERDYYKARYNEFNEAFIENGRKLTK